ncbi:MAG TPA: beta-N-acetylhexosaminidase [Terracidiphilus sp.]|jgi:beta-N-acetylhexosaminidase|nr:beta-N-acetylhexosaminidase [Terracidiphilus sp.]
MSLRHAAGSFLVVGLGGTELTGLERAWLRLVRPGGVILFKRNITDAPQTRALLDEATGLGVRHSVRCVDVEGGTVNRLRDALAPLPSAQAVETAAHITRKPAFAREHGELIARAVKAFGFNTTLAPVVDLALPESADVLGSRPPGGTSAEVIEYARVYLEALAAHGVTGCGKHFPGLGGAASDTHFVTPEIGRAWQQIWSEDLVPYRELHAAMPMVMMNHAAYPQTPGKNMPASASPFWITTVLRKRIGYRGIILSDDLEMGGILKFMPVDEAAIAAIRAGSDLLEICHSAELILRSYEALIAEGERSQAFRSLLTTRAREVERKRARLYSAGTSRPLTVRQFDSLRKQIQQFGEKTKAASVAVDTIDPRTASPAETS